MLDQLLIQLGVNIASQTIYDIARSYFFREKNPTIDGLKNEIANYLNIENADIKAESIIKFFAQNGDITISGSSIYAQKSITMASTQGTKFSFGDNSSSVTDKSSIVAGHGATIVGQGGARIVQDEDGNISFYA